MIYFLAFLSGVVALFLLKYFPYATVLLCVSAAVYLIRKKKYVVAALLVIGLLYPAVRHARPGELPFKSGYVTMTGHFSAPPEKLDGGFAQEFELDGGWRLDVLSGREFETGRQQELRLRVVTPTEKKNPGAFKGDQYAVLDSVRGEGEVSASVTVFFNRLRERLNKTIAERFAPEPASLIMAVTTGHRGGMSYEIKEAFRASGVAHLLSISGTHFGLMFLLLFGAFRAVLKYLPVKLLERLTIYLTPSQAAALLCMPFLLLYLGISGARVPTVRSFIMVSLFLFGLLVGRKGRWLNFLVLAAFALVLIDPEVLKSLSFHLSFLAVLFIGFFLGGKPSKKEEGDFAEEPPKKPSLLRYPLTSIGITVAATLGVEPVVAYYFHYSSIISPLANLIVTPLVCMVLVPLSVAGSFTYILSGGFPLESVTGWVAETAISLVRTSSGVPYSSVPVPPFPLAVLVFYYAGFLLYFVFRDKRLIAIPAISILVPLAVMGFSGRSLAVTFLDAGRGDASVVELPDGKTLVVDAGRRGKEVRRYLRHRGLQGIDALALTHADYYHTGGAATLVEQVGAAEIWDNGMLEYPEGFPGAARRRGLGRGDAIDGEGYSINVFHPYEGYGSGSGAKGAYYNDNSLVLRVVGGGVSVLFVGDIGPAAMKDLLRLKGYLDSDVIKLSDHGKWGSAHEEFISAVSPSVVIAGGGPDADMERYLEGTRIYYTEEVGAVRVEEKDGGLDVRTYDDMVLSETRSPAGELGNFKRLFKSW